MDTPYDAMPNVDEALGKAVKDAAQCERELRVLRNTSAHVIVLRLQELVQIIQDEQPVDPQETMDSLVCPLKHDVGKLLQQRTALTQKVQQAQDFIHRQTHPPDTE